VKNPPMSGIDGIRLDCFEVGKDYEVGNSIGALFLAEGWAELVVLDAPAQVQPFAENDPFNPSRLYRSANTPTNLERERHPPYLLPPTFGGASAYEGNEHDTATQLRGDVQSRGVGRCPETAAAVPASPSPMGCTLLR
jgi:hypothetical protein